jgi:hypothetical protein
MTPTRIQLSRRRGWRKPPNCVVVSRPSRWGNPYRIGETYEGTTVRDAHDAVILFRHGLESGRIALSRSEIVAALGGKDLGCWCAPGTHCHADVLLEWANPKIKRDPATHAVVKS